MHYGTKKAELMMNSMLQHTSILTPSKEQQVQLSSSVVGKELLAIFEKQSLTPVFQPIIDLKNRSIFAHEALIRGPKNSFLHNPLNLLHAAEEHDCLFEIDWLARLLSIHSFQHQRAESLLFLNVTVNTLMQKTHKSGITLEYLQLSGVPIERVVIEITELQPIKDFRAFVESVDHYRKMGFKVAIDDLGAGYNGLRIWSEIKPDFVKIDHHFICDIDIDNDKHRFMETICTLAKNLGTKIVAEGIETYGELMALEKLEVDFVQGFLFKRPHETINNKLDFIWPAANSQVYGSTQYATAGHILQEVFTTDLHCNIMDVARFFLANPEMSFLPVIEDDIIYGMIWRETIMSHIVKALEYCANPSRTLSTVIDTEIITIPIETALYDVAKILTGNHSGKQTSVFIITEKGHYKGCGLQKDVLARLVANPPLMAIAS
jgi:EAL domain-containing protein (putative c-di-GMP-specific phosphodiesterase class I)/predicted transcriptional regulator